MKLESVVNDISTKPYLKQQYRATLGITGDILQACMDAGIDGTLISKVARQANLSYNAILDHCQRLTEAGLINSIRNKRNYIVMITEKGIKFFKEFQKFQDIIKEVNIRY